MKILTAQQMAEVDRLTTKRYRIPQLLLMENAGRCVADELEKEYADFRDARIVILCGGGNNGGDGFVAARYLALRGASPSVLLFSDPGRLKGDAKTNWEIVCAMGLSVRILPTVAEARSCLRKQLRPDIVVDALFGTGLSKPIGPGLKPVIEWINREGSRALVVSVDIPSGIFADDASIPGPAVRADLTVTFSALKLAHVVPPASLLAGKVALVQIGSPPQLYESPHYRMNLVDEAQVRQILPPREPDSHKGSFGHVHIVAGSRGKSGAALMAGLAALRSGAGLATLWTPGNLLPDLAGKYPELMMEPVAETEDGTCDQSAAGSILARTDEMGSLVIGPGLTTHPSTRKMVEELVRRTPVPVILDADGINALALAAGPVENRRKQPVVLTPHPGEMARLTGLSVSQVQDRRLETACECSANTGCYVILKGHQTVIATPDGDIYINPTGNPGMATGGTGDVLAGMLGRFAAAWGKMRRNAPLRKLDDYLCAAVYLHGMAGDLGVEAVGEEALMATDLLEYLPDAFHELQADE